MRDVPWEDIFKLSASAATSESRDWVQVWTNVYISHRKYQVKPLSSSWFLGACAVPHQASNHWDRLILVEKGFLKLPNMHMLIKQKSPSHPRNFVLGIFVELPAEFSTKVNMLYLLYSMGWKCRFLHLLKQNCLLNTFLRILILMAQVSIYLLSLL